MPGRDAFIELLRWHGLMVQIKRRGRESQRHTQDRMALQDDHSHNRRVPSGVETDYSVLQHPVPSHEHRHADSCRGARTGRRTEALLEKSVGRPRGCAARLGFLSHEAQPETKKVQSCVMTVPDTVSV